MKVGMVGTGPAVDAIRTALRNGEATSEPIVVESITAAGIEDVDLGVVVDMAGAEVFERVNSTARANEVPWLTVELGGVGGRGVCEAAITGFGVETACYTCLCVRVAANIEDDAEISEPTIDPATARLAGAHAGYEATKLCAGERSEVLGSVIELPHTERRLLVVPNCACARERDRTLVRENDERDLDAALGRAERALDSRVGVVSEVGEVASFPAPYYLARSGETTGFSDASATSEAAGVAVDWNRAFMKAIGEALERYSAGVYRDSDFTHVSFESLDNAVSLDSFVVPSGGEIRPRETIPWVSGENLATGEGVWVPAETVVFPPAESHGPSITTGLSLGNSGIGALCGGLYETIERDAAMVSWYSTFEPLGLAVDDDGFSTLARRARAEGLDVTPVLLTQDVDVPVVAVAVERPEWPRFAVGSAASFDPVAAARSALAEALQSWMELRSMGPEAADTVDGAIGRYATTPGVAAEFFDVDGRLPAESVGPETVPTGVDEFDALLGRVTDAELDAYAARLTPRDVETLGFEAVRVLVPAFQPLFTDEPYFGRRARTVPTGLGFDPRLDHEFHPYP